MPNLITPQQRRNTRARLRRAQERRDDRYAAELRGCDPRTLNAAQLAIIDASDRRQRQRDERNARRRDNAALDRRSRLYAQRRAEADAARNAEAHARIARRRAREQADIETRARIANLERAVRSAPAEEKGAALARWRVEYYFRNAELDVATPTRWLKLAYRWLDQLDGELIKFNELT